ANLPEKDRALIPEQVRRFHEFHMLIADGDYYRLHSWNDEEPYDCWMNTEKDGSCALITYVQVLGRPSTCSRKVYLRGLVPDAEYEIQEVNPSRVDMGYGRFTAQKRGYGDELMNAGFLVPSLGDYESRLYSVKRVRENS
ncbi:MAG: GH36 C-terminal domain-containing protein, partial [Lachnospiraceae bacterium]|nr:GH36 C-terminal domain-containing protein [Lachnospiraceae bacterium]